jgi:hypothetical protein
MAGWIGRCGICGYSKLTVRVHMCVCMCIIANCWVTVFRLSVKKSRILELFIVYFKKIKQNLWKNVQWEWHQTEENIIYKKVTAWADREIVTQRTLLRVYVALLLVTHETGTRSFPFTDERTEAQTNWPKLWQWRALELPRGPGCLTSESKSELFHAKLSNAKQNLFLKSRKQDTPQLFFKQILLEFIYFVAALPEDPKRVAAEGSLDGVLKNLNTMTWKIKLPYLLLVWKYLVIVERWGVGCVSQESWNENQTNNDMMRAQDSHSGLASAPWAQNNLEELCCTAGTPLSTRKRVHTGTLILMALVGSWGAQLSCGTRWLWSELWLCGWVCHTSSGPLGPGQAGCIGRTSLVCLAVDWPSLGWEDASCHPPREPRHVGGPEGPMELE